MARSPWIALRWQLNTGVPHRKSSARICLWVNNCRSDQEVYRMKIATISCHIGLHDYTYSAIELGAVCDTRHQCVHAFRRSVWQQTTTAAFRVGQLGNRLHYYVTPNEPNRSTLSDRALRGLQQTVQRCEVNTVKSQDKSGALLGGGMGPRLPCERSGPLWPPTAPIKVIMTQAYC